MCYDPIHMHKPKGRLKSPIKIMYMCLGSVRKPDDTEKTLHSHSENTEHRTLQVDCSAVWLGEKMGLYFSDLLFEHLYKLVTKRWL